MGKLLFIAVAVVFAWLVIRSYRRSLKRDESPPAAKAEDMVRCAHCGVHMPRSESHAGGDKFFCCEEHSRLHG